jgi:hypothetical protein
MAERVDWFFSELPPGPKADRERLFQGLNEALEENKAELWLWHCEAIRHTMTVEELRIDALIMKHIQAELEKATAEGRTIVDEAMVDLIVNTSQFVCAVEYP